MKNVYRPGSYKSGPVVRRVAQTNTHMIHLMGVNHATKWKRPCTKKTCADLLYQDDEKPGMLTSEQRRTCEARAGDAYKKRDPFLKRPNESIADYTRRINKLVGG